jgi:hypothetical protein
MNSVMKDHASITFDVIQEGTTFIAKWDAPMSTGGITTQAESLPDLIQAVTESVECHFDENDMPKEVKLHFVHDPALALREAA